MSVSKLRLVTGICMVTLFSLIILSGRRELILGLSMLVVQQVFGVTIHKPVAFIIELIFIMI